MYIWKIDKLSAQLMSGDLEESESFKYLMASTILYALATIQYDMPNDFDTLAAIISVFISAGGLWFIYKCNGGKNGKNIIQRYLAIGWVVFVRLFVLFLLPAVIAMTVTQEIYFGGAPEETSIAMFTLMLVSEVIYIIWVAKHIKHIANNSHD